MSIKALHLTGAARSFFGTPRSLGTAPAGELSRWALSNSLNESLGKNWCM
jgi:hypothetical protein